MNTHTINTANPEKSPIQPSLLSSLRNFNYPAQIQQEKINKFNHETSKIGLTHLDFRQEAGTESFKLFLDNLPTGITSEVLTLYFFKYLDRFSINRSKNKGKKSKLFAIMEVYSLEDANKIYSTKHIVKG